MSGYRPLAARSAFAHWWAQLCVSVQGRSLVRFRSNDEFFAALRALIADLERSGRDAPAAALKDGFSCLNGLTDGWVALLDAIEEVRANAAKGMTEAQRARLHDLRDATRFAVYRP